jgi:hypothetical protein
LELSNLDKKWLQMYGMQFWFPCSSHSVSQIASRKYSWGSFYYFQWHNNRAMMAGRWDLRLMWAPSHCGGIFWVFKFYQMWTHSVYKNISSQVCPGFKSGTLWMRSLVSYPETKKSTIFLIFP